MATKGATSTYFLPFVAILLMNISVVDSQGLPDISDIFLQLSYTDGELSHVREKRDASVVPLEYIVVVEINMSQVILIEQIKSSLDSISLPLQLDNSTEVSGLNITTVCVNNTGYSCRCEDQYLWPCDKCVQYGHCDDIINATCGCLNDVPSDGQYCQPIAELTNVTCPIPTVPPPPIEYMAEIEIDTLDAAVLNQLRTLLKNLSLPFRISEVQMTGLNITTECLLNNTGYQCICEDQYFWPCNKCAAYGYCDDIISASCGCIRGFPDDGQFCQPMTELNNLTCPTPTVPPTSADYMIEVEIHTVDAAVLNQLRTLLKNLSLPLGISDVQITELNITTVCLLNNTGYQCGCEDQYFWPCDKCTKYGSCDNINNVTCGCIRAVPDDGQFCQPMTELTNTTPCPVPTTPAPPPTEYVVDIEIHTVDAAVLNQLRTLLKNLSFPLGISDVQITELNITTVCLLNNTGYQCRCEDQYFWPCNKCAAYGRCDNINNVTCGCIRAVPDDGRFCQPMTELTNISCPIPTVLPPRTEYVVEIEIDTVDAAVLNQLRTLLKNLSFPLGISDVQITELNITTVCVLNTTGYQCRCEDQYFWPCNKCAAYGHCDNISNVTCGCIRAVPNDGRFCQPMTELTNITPCPTPSPTAPPLAEYVVEIEIHTLDAAVLNQLRTLLKNLSLPLGISDVQITELNITTVCVLNNTGYQCRCEDQYFWPCNKCAAYGRCDNVNNVRCGCIRAVPNDGQFCQPMTELTNISACSTPSPTAPPPAEYVVEIEIHTVDAAVLNQLRTLLKNLSFPLGISDIQITELNITTVCVLNNTGYQCRCEDQYFWPCNKCAAYGRCDNVNNVRCGCIRAVPNDGQFCQPMTELTNISACSTPSLTAPPPTEYVVEIEIDTVDAAVLNQLRTLLKNLSFPLGISDVQITELNITTVCVLNNTGYQCRCEDQYFWPCNKCAAYGRCDNVNNVRCGCIRAVPNDGQFCQPMTELTNISACSTPSPTAPPPAEYVVEIEIHTVDAAVLNQLRTLLKNLSFPLGISDVQITELNITTVCVLNNTGYQCRCEDQYFWPCNKCAAYGRCDNVNNVRCGCIRAVPNDGQFCQPMTELTNIPACSTPSPTAPPPAEYVVEIEIHTVDAAVLNQLRTLLKNLSFPLGISDVQITELNITTVCVLNNTGYQCRCEDQYFWPCNKCAAYGRCDNVNNVRCGCIRAVPNDGQFCQPMTELTDISACSTPSPTAPPPAEYVVEIEIHTVDAAVLNQLRTLLKNLSFPLGISDVQITELNITTVCVLNNTGYQCRCEDQYFWPCNKCAAYGRCDNVNNVRCGCIRAVPNDGQFCQPMTELTNITPCPTPSPTDITPYPTPSSTVPSSPIEYMVEIQIDTLDAAVLNQLRTFLKNLGLPLGISDIQITEPSITTVCLLNNTGYQCQCEDQYFWPCNTCTAYGPCDNVSNVTCGCIAAVPDDGQFCQPMTELTNITPCPTPSPTGTSTPSTSTGTTAPDITTGTTAPNSTTGTSAPDTTTGTTTPNGTTESTAPDTTIVTTTLNSTTGTTAPDTTTGTTAPNTTTGTTVPDTTTGATAPNTTSGTTAPDTTTGTIAPNTTTGTTAPDTTTGATAPNTTTGTTAPDTTSGTTALDTTKVTTAPDTTSGTTAPDTTKVTNAPNTTKMTTAPGTTTVPTASDTATETSSPKTTTKTSDPVPTTVVSTSTTATPAEYTVTLSLTIDEKFDNTLTDKTSQKYQKYRKEITSSVDSVYSAKLSSYKAGSAKVIQFRPGSVIADFTIATTSNTLDFSAANRQLASALRGEGYNVNEDSFAQTVENGLYDPRKGNIYPGKDMVLTCNPPALSTGGITWSFSDSSLVSSPKHQISPDEKTLTVKSTNEWDHGKYTCKTTLNSIPYIIWQRMVIQPSPNVRVTTSKTVYCDGSPITVECCAEDSYMTKWSMDTGSGPRNLTELTIACSSYSYSGFSEAECKDDDKNMTFLWEVYDLNGNLDSSDNVRITATGKRLHCYNTQFGVGKLGDLKTNPCDADSVGTMTARCVSDTEDKSNWTLVENTCVLRVLQALVDKSENLQVPDVPQFTADLRNATESNIDKITGSVLNVLTVVHLMKVIANVSQSFIVDKSIMTDFLKTSDVISTRKARKTWEKLNQNNSTQKTSSDLLKSAEDIGGRLTDDNFTITTNSTQLDRTITSGPFFGTFGVNSTTQINLPELTRQTLITTIVFSAYDNVLPVRNATYNDNRNDSKNDSINNSKTDTTINGDVVAVIVNNTVYNISLTFDIKNKSLVSPRCVFWNFSLLDGIGGWDSTGCEVKPVVNQTGKFKCECNHTTSFSILMSPFFVDNPVLAFITFICVGISIICLILALIIEIIVWKPLTRNDTAYMRHVSIVNIALSLLIADICFIIGAAIVNKGEATPLNSCSTATFFMHFFYLALFFWMLFSALLLLYHTLMVFVRMSKSVMMAIAFSVGYGAPLLIAVITVAVTAGGRGYIQEENACWLNWNKTKAMLAFVIPALTIVAVNLVVLVVVLYKTLRRGVGNVSQPDEKHPLMMIAKCVAILTPLFGLTWGFGVGTMVTSALGIHIVFALLNSLQGFFVLVFGILLDSKIRKALAERLKLQNLKNLTFSRTRSTSAGPSSSSGPRGGRNGYNISSGSGSSADASSSIADTVTNT